MPSRAASRSSRVSWSPRSADCSRLSKSRAAAATDPSACSRCRASRAPTALIDPTRTATARASARSSTSSATSTARACSGRCARYPRPRRRRWCRSWTTLASRRPCSANGRGPTALFFGRGQRCATTGVTALRWLPAGAFLCLGAPVTKRQKCSTRRRWPFPMGRACSRRGWEAPPCNSTPTACSWRAATTIDTWTRRRSSASRRSRSRRARRCDRHEAAAPPSHSTRAGSSSSAVTTASLTRLTCRARKSSASTRRPLRRAPTWPLRAAAARPL
jgi:hypothetical protein